MDTGIQSRDAKESREKLRIPDRGIARGSLPSRDLLELRDSQLSFSFLFVLIPSPLAICPTFDPFFCLPPSPLPSKNVGTNSPPSSPRTKKILPCLGSSEGDGEDDVFRPGSDSFRIHPLLLGRNGKDPSRFRREEIDPFDRDGMSEGPSCPTIPNPSSHLRDVSYGS